MMNEKASVSKELSAKHAKLLEALLKLPENRECADCRSKAPRWASINFGIFICMQCSGIHRSLGVHISKVRSTTLDTWLPEQVMFMQRMGNEKSNKYWEAELQPQFDRNPIEKFIHSKYVERKWASKVSQEPALVVSLDKSVSTSRRGIPKKARKYSLDEDISANELVQVAPTIRNRSISSVFSMYRKQNKTVQLYLHHVGLPLSELIHQIEEISFRKISSVEYMLVVLLEHYWKGGPQRKGTITSAMYLDLQTSYRDSF